MSNKLSLARDFTRFLDDPTFPYKVTVCVGDKRVLCSGVLLAQQSSVLERKFREDDGVLMFEEMLDVISSNEGILKCIHYLHGADLQFSIETIAVVLKFGSLYEIGDLFERGLEWLKQHLNTSKSVRGAVNFLTISNSLNADYSAKVKSVICQFIKSNREMFGTQCADLLEIGVSGQDMILIINENPVNSGDILKKWTALSINNREFIVRNHSSIDFTKVFSNSEEFFSFIALMSEGASSAESIKSLLNIQTSFFESQKPKNTDPRNEKQTPTLQSLKVETEKKPPTPQSSSKIQDVTQQLSWLQIDYQQFSSSSVTKPLGKEKVDAPITGSQVVGPESSKSQNEGNWDKDFMQLQSLSADDVYKADILGVSDRQVHIQNIPPTASKTKLRKLFSSAGKMQSIEIIPEDSRAVITFPDAFQAALLNSFCNEEEITLDGCVLKICKEPWEESSEEEFNETKLYIGNIPPHADGDGLKKIFCGFGKIIDVTIKKGKRGKNFGFITFAKVTSAYNLLQRSHTKSYDYDGYELVINTVNRKAD